MCQAKSIGIFVRETNKESGPIEDPAISYQVVETMNSRTAEQGTAEYRSEKYCLTAFKNFCCSKFLVRYSIFKIQAGSRSKLD